MTYFCLGYYVRSGKIQSDFLLPDIMQVSDLVVHPCVTSIYPGNFCYPFICHTVFPKNLQMMMVMTIMKMIMIIVTIFFYLIVHTKYFPLNIKTLVSRSRQSEWKQSSDQFLHMRTKPSAFAFSVDYEYNIDHFLVALSLCFQASLNAKPLI